MVEPSAMSCFSAELASMTTSCGPAGACPELTSMSPLSTLSAGRLVPMVGVLGAAWIALPWLSSISAYPVTTPSAARTPSTLRTWSRTLSEMGPRLALADS